jgi:hypothetical protein
MGYILGYMKERSEEVGTSVDQQLAEAGIAPHIILRQCSHSVLPTLLRQRTKHGLMNLDTPRKDNIILFYCSNLKQKLNDPAKRPSSEIFDPLFFLNQPPPIQNVRIASDLSEIFANIRRLIVAQ